MEIDARPSPLEIDPARAAVVVVDMQNDFAADGGMFVRAGVPVAGIRAVVEPTARILAAARRAGMAVVYLKMEFEPDLSNAGGPNAPNRVMHRAMGAGEPAVAPDGSPSRVLVKDTWNTEILPELASEPGDVVVSKHRYSGFFETDLDAILKERGVSSLVFTGCTTSVCVDSTLRDAFFRGYRCLLLEDCTAEPIGSHLARGNHEATLLVVETLFGWVASSAALLDALAAEPALA
jgi:ureidoacrylate peracid hydrolase